VNPTVQLLEALAADALTLRDELVNLAVALPREHAGRAFALADMGSVVGQALDDAAVELGGTRTSASWSRHADALRRLQQPKPIGPVETIVRQVVQEFAQAGGRIEVSAVLAEAARRLPEPTDGRRDTRHQHVKRALAALCQAGACWIEGDYLASADATR
jgi:hypothetical protein